MHELIRSSIRWWHARSPALLYCCWDTGEPPHYLHKSRDMDEEHVSSCEFWSFSCILKGKRPFLSPLLVQRNSCLYHLVYIHKRFTLCTPYPAVLLLETAPHSFIYSIFQHSGESAVLQRSLVECSPNFTWHQSTPKAGENNHQCIGEFNSSCWSCLEILCRNTVWQWTVYLLRRTCALATRGRITSNFHPPPSPCFLPYHWAVLSTSTNNHHAQSSSLETACKHAPEPITTWCQPAHFPFLSHRSAAKLV